MEHKMAIRYLIASFLAFAVSLSMVNANEVVGLWTFAGTAGEQVEDKTEFANQIPDQELKLQVLLINDGGFWGFAGKLPTYLDETPASCLFSDTALTNHIGSMTSSLRLDGGSRFKESGYSAYMSGTGLEIPNFGEVVGDGSWTVEVLARVADAAADGYTHGYLVSLMGAGAASTDNKRPCIYCNPYPNGGQIKGFNGSTKVFEVNFNSFKPNRISGKNISANVWRNVTLSYDATNKKYIYRSDYSDFECEVAIADADRDFNEKSTFRISGVFSDETPDGALGRIDVAAVRVTRGVVPWYGCMAPWIASTPKELVHYRFSGENGATIANVENAVAPTLDYMSCTARNSPTDATLLGSSVYSDMVSGPFISCTNKQTRLENTSSASSHVDDSWGCLRYYLQNLPAYFADSFTLEMLVWCETANLNADNPYPSVSLFCAPAGQNGKEKGFRLAYQQSTFKVLARTADSCQTVLQSAWSAYKYTREAWHHVCVTYDKTLSKMTVYLDYNPVEKFESTQDGALPAGSPVWFSDADFQYAELLGSASGWLREFQGVVDEVRITRGVLAPEDFLTAKNKQFGLGSLLFLR